MQNDDEIMNNCIERGRYYKWLVVVDPTHKSILVCPLVRVCQGIFQQIWDPTKHYFIFLNGASRFAPNTEGVGALQIWFARNAKYPSKVSWVVPNSFNSFQISIYFNESTHLFKMCQWSYKPFKYFKNNMLLPDLNSFFYPLVLFVHPDNLYNWSWSHVQNKTTPN